MHAVFRVDASIEIGTGHVMRCLTLAEKLREKGAIISFICRELPGNLNNFIENKGFGVHRIKNASLHVKEIEPITVHSHWLTVDWDTDVQDTLTVIKNKETIDWFIIDHYGIEMHWEQRLRSFVRKIMVIDDLGDREHDCDILLDQNFINNFRTRYDRLVPNHCLKLLGPQHVLLRSEFKNEGLEIKKRNGEVKHILIYFGGIDITNETTKALEAIRMVNRSDISVDVVVGSSCPHENMIKNLCSLMPNITFWGQGSNMVDLIVKADLAIGAGGITTWERLFLGLPAITIILSLNQANILAALNEAGAVWNLGYHEEVLPKDIAQKVSEVLANPDVVRKMSEKGKSLMGDNHMHVSDLMFKILEEEHAGN